jgi:hypothetical protein
MPTDPYVPATIDEIPRQEQNFAPGVHMPAARGWHADRPGDGRRDVGALSGSPGPNVGFAITLAHRARDRFRLEPGEHAEDAVAVVAELAMKRAATFGRAPTTLDVEFAVEVLGYAGPPSNDLRTWRPERVRGAAHDYVARRRMVDAVDASVLRLPVVELPEHLTAVRAAMAHGDSAPTGREAAETLDPS